MADNTEQRTHKLIPCDFQKYDLHIYTSLLRPMCKTN